MSEKHRVGRVIRREVETPVVAEADVVVAGGGAAGCLAALAAAQRGAEVILVERQGYLGGMMTAGNAGLTKYLVHNTDPVKYRGIVEELATDPGAVQMVGGLAMDLTQRLIDTGAAIGTHGRAGSYVFADPVKFKWLLLDMMQEAGVKLMLHSMLVDILQEGDTVEGVVVEGKSGSQAVTGRVTVDATGDADICAWAGVPFVVGVCPDDETAKAGTMLGRMQVMGVMYRLAGVDMARCLAHLEQHPELVRLQTFSLMSLADMRASFEKGEMMVLSVHVGDRLCQFYNSPLPGVFTVCGGSSYGNGLSTEALTHGEIEVSHDIRNAVAAIKTHLPGFENAYVLDCPELCVRETRHIRGEHVLNADDVIHTREFEDTIGRGCHPVDVNPTPAHIKEHKLSPRWYYNIPYRTLVPLKAENLLVAGRCISATREGAGCIRVTAQCMVTGEAAGAAAALCGQRDETPRSLDVAALQESLRNAGCIL